MNLPLAVFLIVLLIVGIGLFYRACSGGMRFGDRLEEKKKASEEQTRESDGGPDDQR